MKITDNFKNHRDMPSYTYYCHACELLVNALSMTLMLVMASNP